ncbi:MAG: hypothetical protein AAGG65_19860 [Pseudomonadota bacterium]
MTRTFKRLSVLLLATVAVAGCSTLNPYVDAQMRRPGFDGPSGVERAFGVRTTASEAPTSVSIAQVRQYARSLHNAYVNAVAQQERLNSGAQLSLIPLAATAAGLGITGGSSEAIAVLGLTGAGVTVAGTVAINEERQRIYLAGASALTCIQDLANDFEIAVPFAAEFELGGRAANAIDRLLETQLELRLALETLSPSPNERQQADEALEQSRATLASAYALQAFLRVPGQVLLFRVDEIQDLVNRLIQGASVDLTTFASTLTGRLGAVQAQLIPPSPSDEVPLQASIDEFVPGRPATIEIAITNVVVANTVLAAVIESSGVALDLPDRSCITDFPNTSNALSISPEGGISGPASGEFTANLIVTGGTPPYGVILPPGVEDPQRIPMGRSRERFDIVIPASLPSGTITIFDANDRQVPLTVPISRGP